MFLKQFLILNRSCFFSLNQKIILLGAELEIVFLSERCLKLNYLEKQPLKK